MTIICHNVIVKQFCAIGLLGLWDTFVYRFTVTLLMVKSWQEYSSVSKFNVTEYLVQGLMALIFVKLDMTVLGHKDTVANRLWHAQCSLSHHVVTG